MGIIGSLLRRLVRILVDITVVLLMLTLLPGLPPNVKYSAYEVEESLPFEGPLAKNSILDDSKRILDGKINGPESIASRKDFEIFTGLHNGKILRVWGKRFDHFKTVTTIGPGCDGPWQEKICGRPLGIRFAPDGRLVVVDTYLGLFAVDVDTGEKERLYDFASEIDGALPKVPNDLDIDAEGNIYWSDSSTVGDLSNGLIEMLSEPTGRLIKFDPKTKTNTVIVKNVHFANGVQLSPDHDFVLVCETFRSRVLRHWLAGPKAGTTEVFVDRLPGKPDNVRARKEGGYRVSLVAVDNKEKGDVMKILSKYPLARKLILRLLGIPKFLFDTISSIYPNQFTENAAYKIYHLQPVAEVIASNAAVIVELDAEGNIESSLQGDSGIVRFISEAEQVGDYLFFGSPYNNYIGYLRIAFSPEEEEEEKKEEAEPPFMEVDGQGVRMKSFDDNKETDEEEAQGEQKDEVKDTMQQPESAPPIQHDESTEQTEKAEHGTEQEKVSQKELPSKEEL